MNDELELIALAEEIQRERRVRWPVALAEATHVMRELAGVYPELGTEEESDLRFDLHETLRLALEIEQAQGITADEAYDLAEGLGSELVHAYGLADRFELVVMESGR